MLSITPTVDFDGALYYDGIWSFSVYDDFIMTIKTINSKMKVSLYNDTTKRNQAIGILKCSIYALEIYLIDSDISIPTRIYPKATNGLIGVEVMYLMTLDRTSRNVRLIKNKSTYIKYIGGGVPQWIGGKWVGICGDDENEVHIKIISEDSFNMKILHQKRLVTILQYALPGSDSISLVLTKNGWRSAPHLCKLQFNLYEQLLYLTNNIIVDVKSLL